MAGAIETGGLLNFQLQPSAADYYQTNYIR